MRDGRSRSVVIRAAVVGLLAAGAVGCDSPGWRHAREKREEAMERSVRMVSTLDDRRPENLAHTAKIIAERQRRDEQAIRSDMTKIGRWLEEEFEQWSEREPAYRRAIGRELEGNPANAKRTAPYFIY